MGQKLAEAQETWMRELNRIGTEDGIKGFPVPLEMLIDSCWLSDFEEGLTPREAIDGEREDADPELLRRKRRAEARAWKALYE